MDKVDEYARLKAQIRDLEHRAAALRVQFLHPGAQLRSNQYEMLVRRQTRPMFQKDLLPPGILNDPQYWTDSEVEAVVVRPLERSVKSLKYKDDIVLIEPFFAEPRINALASRG